MFGISHQKAGLNWEGKFKEGSRERRLADAMKKKTGRHGEGETGRHGDAETRRNGEHAKWRRITGITSAVEGALTGKERKEGLGRLVKWIENGIKNAELRIQNGTENGRGSGFRVQGMGNGTAGAGRPHYSRRDAGAPNGTDRLLTRAARGEGT